MAFFKLAGLKVTLPRHYAVHSVDPKNRQDPLLLVETRQINL